MGAMNYDISWKLHFAKIYAWPVELLLLAIPFVLIWHNVRKSQRASLISLRLVTYALLVFMIHQPFFEKEKREPVKQPLAIMVDFSKSMEVGKPPRLSRAIDSLKRQQPAIETLKKQFQVKMFAFGDKLQPLNLDILQDNPEALYSHTDFQNIFAAIPSRDSVYDKSIALVVSDGADHGKLRQLVLAPDEKSQLPEAVQIYASLPPDEGKLPDVAVEDIQAPHITYLRDATKITVKVRAHHIDKKYLRVDLSQTNRVITTKTINLDPNQQLYEISLSFRPQKLGKSLYTVSVSEFTEEITHTNNKATFVTKVVWDRIRILHVCGKPSWDQKFLRHYLKKNPNIDLISFFILRSPVDDPEADPSELSLIPFPYQDLFSSSLTTFDVVIFQNFDFKTYFSRIFLRNIRDYVSRGGAFVMIGGDRSFANGGYRGTPIEEILPVELPTKSKPFVRSTKKVRRPQGQLVHPILSAARSDATSQWSKLPAIQGYNQIRRLRASSARLLETNSGVPIFVIGDHKLGRTAAILTDSLWRWNFVEAGVNGNNDRYFSFWKNLIHWLIKDPAYKLLRIHTDKDRYELNQAVEIEVTASKSDFRPLANRKVTIDLQSTDGTATYIQRSLVTNAQGKASLRLDSLPAGNHQIRAAIRSLPASNYDTLEFIEVGSRSGEMRQLQPDPNYLQALSNKSGGAFLPIQELFDANKYKAEPLRSRTIGRTSHPIWASAWIYLVFVLLLASDWYLRQRWG